MKKCPTCEKTFEDSMRFCQVDGTALVDDAPAFDPFATIVAHQITPDSEAEKDKTPELEVDDKPGLDNTVSSIPIAEPSDVLDLPGNDPLQTMYVSESELKETLGEADSSSKVVDISPVEEVSEPDPPSFLNQATATPPPSPFSVPDEDSRSELSPAADPVSRPPATDEPAPPAFDEAATMIQPSFNSPFESSEPAPVAEWNPPPAPEPSWQNQEIGANTPFQPPIADSAGQSKVLAIVSLVTGILSIFCCSSVFIMGIAAVITGILARKKAAANPNEFGGQGLALAGIITGGLSFVIGILYWILILSGVITLPNF